MLAARILTALGLALLLVIGAWSASHGDADVHASLCLAPGATATDAAGPAGPAGAGHGHEVAGATAPDSDGAVVSGFAALWVLALLALIAHAARGGRGILPPRLSSSPAPPRPGPGALPTALSLAQLSVSRT